MAAGFAELRRYVDRLRAQGRVTTSVHARHADAAMSMLMAALFSDALGRDDLAEVFSLPKAEAPAMYARVFLTALGVTA
jgi:hypothetical protein